MSTGLTPEQRAAAAATLRQWRSHQPDQGPCHYCGTLVPLQDAELVPDNPADPYDHYACAACGAEGLGHMRARDHSTRRHRARQVRARIVALAQEYREACRQHEEVSVYVMSLVTPPEVLRDEEQRVWEGMEQRRAALFVALGELEMLEEDEEQGPVGRDGWCEHAPVGAHLCRRCHERESGLEGEGP